tara:strand:+ start:214 stop:807 length:594 start_codon:yes stop_codon:yes gene_type:complete
MRVIKLGLTGSIGMGKTRTTLMFKYLGVPVFEADRKVHELFNKNIKLIKLIEKNFDGVVKNNNINRKTLGNIVFQNKKKKEILENLVHPYVRFERKKFTMNAIKNQFPIVLYDIPLLFETKSEKYYDYVIVVSASKFIQKKRVLNRAGMTKEIFKNINMSQMSDYKKRNRADFIIYSGLGVSHAFRNVKLIISKIRN